MYWDTAARGAASTSGPVRQIGCTNANTVGTFFTSSPIASYTAGNAFADGAGENVKVIAFTVRSPASKLPVYFGADVRQSGSALATNGYFDLSS